MISVGQEVSFNAMEHIRTYGYSVVSSHTTGRVVEVYPEHRWFSVEYKLGNVTNRISFKFSDIGVNVVVVKGDEK